MQEERQTQEVYLASVKRCKRMFSPTGHTDDSLTLCVVKADQLVEHIPRQINCLAVASAGGTEHHVFQCHKMGMLACCQRTCQGVTGGAQMLCLLNEQC